MENWLIASLPIILKTAASCIMIMATILIIVRIYGLRSFAKMSSVDFASTIAVGSILAAVAMNTGQSWLKGTVAMLCIIGFQQLFSYGKRHFDWLENIGENQPVLLMRKGEIFQENMAKSGVTHADLMAKLREANVLRLSEVKAVVFETTGDVSVLHGDEDSVVEECLLEGIRG
ncbi:DUF421 domain-containing protein [Neolewinella agarilytica]|uniref:YetF C-terminal domain-containing protein n=1 Tax=Neolewinella agarilytica TaxID=478744 RepID=A0A1H9GCC7_9BACT|nr:YetF domain-containing protein [Neolewinella agarilytica]SEQ47771.1 Protein of unknown function [Neolewinella agarilytica]